MAKKGVLRSFFGSVFDFRKGLALDQILAYARLIRDSFKDIFTRHLTPTESKETFDEAARRFNLSEQDIVKKTRIFLYFAIFYFVLSVGFVFYTWYLIIHSGSILAVLVGAVLALVLLTHSFREHFWYMQMKKRKTGCNLKDWINFVFMRAQK